MSEMFDSGDLFNPLGADNPFYGVDGYDEETDFEPDEDPQDKVEKQVLETLRLESFGGLIIPASDAKSNELRANRFGDIKEAILYLADARLLGFGQVVIFPNG